MKQLVCILLITTFLSSDTDIVKVFDMRHIDINSKSYLGWARVLNDPDKRKEYKLNDLRQEEIVLYIEQLKKLSSKDADFGGKLK